MNTKNMTHAQAIEIIRNGGLSVRLLVQRGGKVPPLPLDGKFLIISILSWKVQSLSSIKYFIFWWWQIATDIHRPSIKALWCVHLPTLDQEYWTIVRKVGNCHLVEPVSLKLGIWEFYQVYHVKKKLHRCILDIGTFPHRHYRDILAYPWWFLGSSCDAVLFMLINNHTFPDTFPSR